MTGGTGAESDELLELDEADCAVLDDDDEFDDWLVVELDDWLDSDDDDSLDQDELE